MQYKSKEKETTWIISMSLLLRFSQGYMIKTFIHLKNFMTLGDRVDTGTDVLCIGFALHKQVPIGKKKKRN